jgi:ribose transport system substrate-binding protein
VVIHLSHDAVVRRHVLSRFARTVAIASCLAATLGVSACGNSSSKGVEAPKESVAAADTAKELFIGHPSPKMCAGKHYKIGVDYFSTTEEFAQQWIAGIKKVARDSGCVDIVALSDELNPSKALANAQTFSQQKVDGVLLLQVIAAAQPGVMRVLDKTKIPAIASAVPAPGATFVSVPDYDSGLDGGKYLAKQYLDSGKAAKPYLLIGTFPDGGQVSIDRLNGVIDGIKQTISAIPANHILQIDTKADPVGTRDKALAAINKIPKGAPILASAINDSTTYAEFQALKQSGRAQDAMVLGIGGVNPTGLSYVCKNKSYVGTLSHMPDRWGQSLVPAIVDRIQGKALPPAVDVPWKILTRENMRETYPDAPC